MHTLTGNEAMVKRYLNETLICTYMEGIHCSCFSGEI